MDPLVHAKETKEIGRRFIGCCAPFTFPESCAKVVALGEDRTFADVKAMSNGVKVKEPTGKFKIGVGDGAMRVVIGD